jgi:outer membrane protein insertion porin family
MPPGGPQESTQFSARDHGAQFAPTGSQIPVAEVEIRGNQRVGRAKVESFMKTRTGRTFDPIVLETDVSALLASGLFRDVRTFTRQTPAGIAVVVEVVERPKIEYVKFAGNRGVSDKALKKQADLKEGDSLDLYAVQEARRRVEEYYHSKGFGKTQVSILEGDRITDRGVVLAISEGPKQRIWSVAFEGNTIATDARLATQIQSKPGILKYFLRGEVNRDKIDEDVGRLTNYYHSLGFFSVRIGRELTFDDSGDWAYLNFIIDEGPRYAVRNVAVVGNAIYGTDDLMQQLQLKSGEYFNQSKMLADETALRDIYGGEGYIFADIQAKPRFLWDSGQLDVVYDITEGEQWRVGRINIHVGGEYSHTRLNVVRNRITLRPGDIIDMREVRRSEILLKSSQLFLNEPARGIEPRIAVRPPEFGTLESLASRAGDGYRGQSPDNEVPSHSAFPKPTHPAGRPPAADAIPVAEVAIVGHQTVSRAWVESFLVTRRGRWFDPRTLQTDLNSLQATGVFQSVSARTRLTDNGIAVTVELVERPRGDHSANRADLNVYAPTVHR